MELYGSGAGVADTVDRIADQLKRRDTELNAAYRAARARLNPRQRMKLQNAQHAWIAWRNAGCRALEDPDWGTLSRLNAKQCVLDLTIARTKELESYPDSGGPR